MYKCSDISRRSFMRLFGLLLLKIGISYPSISSSKAYSAENLNTDPVFPKCRFVVFSDPHFYSLSLGKSGKFFKQYIEEDRKLLAESEEILDEAVSCMEKIEADFVIIPGDLTKDGEAICHNIFAGYMQRLKKSGKKIFVCPGNHDLLNGHAFKYFENYKKQIETADPLQFASIYSDFGYNDAVMRDSASLSYLAEPVKGLYLLSLDSCRYNDNPKYGEPIIGGNFSAETLKWIKNMLQKAAEDNKAVIVFMHHGIMEHFRGQKKYYGEYIVDNYEYFSEMLANYNVKTVFTGHYHSQDIALKSFGSKFIFDIETGSLITYPCPYRIVEIDENNNMKINSAVIEKIKSHPINFREYAKSYLIKGISGIAEKKLKKMFLSKEEAKIIGPQIARAFQAHYSGDEIPPPNSIDTKGLGLLGRIIVSFKKDLIDGLFNDIYPPDNRIIINLKTGTFS